MSTQSASFQRGDHVRHARRPEWGEGVVDAVEQVQQNGLRAQRLVVKFAHRGRTTLNTAFAEVVPADSFVPPIESEEATAGGGWLAELENQASRSPEGLTVLPEVATDPFRSLALRFEATLDLYRFTTAPRSLLEWAIAQTGMRDPLSEFTRHELEMRFQGFAQRRDAHLRDLVQQLKKKGELASIEPLIQQASPDAQAALRRALR